MAAPLTIQDLLVRHETNLTSFQRIPSFAELIAAGALPKIAIITCADPRVAPEHIFNLKLGEAIVLRVAGGNAQQVINHILSLDSLVSLTDIMIVQHTDCGATVFRDDNIKSLLRERAPGQESKIADIDFGEITGPVSENVQKSMQFLKSAPLLRNELKSGIRGFVFHLESLKVTEVKA